MKDYNSVFKSAVLVDMVIFLGEVCHDIPSNDSFRHPLYLSFESC